MPEAVKRVNALGCAPLYQQDRHFSRLAWSAE